MKKLVIILLMVMVLTACKQSDDKRYESDNHVYTLDLYLDEENETLTVEGELSYLNEIPDLDELYLHIYPNAINMSGNAFNVDFEYLRIDGEEMDIAFLGIDDTLMYFEFDDVFEEDERIDIDFKYTFHYWHDDRLVAINGDYFVTMFFYPYVPVYNDDGWNPEPYSFRGESYFNTWGDYYVTINVPEDYEVAASGGLVDEEGRGSRRELYYEIVDARDFSFSASSRYHIYEEVVDERAYEIYSFNELSSTEQDLYFSYITVMFDIMEEAVGLYDYDHFTLELGYIYGMESTGVIYCSMDVQEGTVAHEIIHQWFYSMIGNDQADEPFLDEALTTYITAYFFEEFYGEGGYDGYLDYRSSTKESLKIRFMTYQGLPILLHLSEYGEGYGYQVYYHGPSIYRYYVEYFLDGDYERFNDALKVYYETYKGREATIEEFFTLLEEVLNEPGTKAWLYEQANDLQDLNNENPFE